MAWRCYAQIFVRNVDRSAAWYEDVLGFEIDYRYGDPPFYATTPGLRNHRLVADQAILRRMIEFRIREYEDDGVKWM